MPHIKIPTRDILEDTYKATISAHGLCLLIFFNFLFFSILETRSLDINLWQCMKDFKITRYFGTATKRFILIRLIRKNFNDNNYNFKLKVKDKSIELRELASSSFLVILHDNEVRVCNQWHTEFKFPFTPIHSKFANIGKVYMNN